MCFDAKKPGKLLVFQEKSAESMLDWVDYLHFYFANNLHVNK